MNIHLSFKNLDSSPAMKAYVQEKSERLNRYFHGKVTVTWNFSCERQNLIAHCHLTGNHMDYFGEGQTNDLYASVDLALERIERQIKKHKEIVKNKLHRHDHLETHTASSETESLIKTGS